MSKSSVHSCSNKNLRAKITVRSQEGGSYIVYGYAVDASTLIRIDGCRPHQRIAHRKENIDAARKYLIGVIDAEFNEKYRKSSVHITHIVDGFFSRAYKEIENKSVLLSPAWGDSTAINRLKYFERQILPRLDTYGQSICGEDQESIRNELVGRAATSKRGNNDATTAASSVSAYLDAADYIYRRMREINPDYGLPDLDLRGTLKRSNILPEQCKALPDGIRVKLAVLLFRLSNISLALGVALMLFSGLRPAEAAAVLIGDITTYGTFAQLPILFQIRNGIRTPILKSSAAYRVVILPFIAVQLVNQYREHLRSLGYTDEQINVMPLSPKVGTNDTFCEGSDISAFARMLLLKAGLSTDFLQSSTTLMLREADIIDGIALKDVSAYILRRDWCSRVSNICGLPRDTVDYLIGHSNRDVKKQDYISYASASKIASMIERFVFLPEYSMNPAFRPITISHGNYDMLPNTEYTFIADHRLNNEIEVTIDPVALEAGHSLTIISSVPVQLVELKKTPRDTTEACRVRPIIGKVRKRAYYDHLILQANEICIDSLTKGKGQ